MYQPTMWFFNPVSKTPRYVCVRLTSLLSESVDSPPTRKPRAARHNPSIASSLGSQGVGIWADGQANQTGGGVSPDPNPEPVSLP